MQGPMKGKQTRPPVHPPRWHQAQRQGWEGQGRLHQGAGTGRCPGAQRLRCAQQRREKGSASGVREAPSRSATSSQPAEQRTRQTGASSHELILIKGEAGSRAPSPQPAAGPLGGGHLLQVSRAANPSQVLMPVTTNHRGCTPRDAAAEWGPHCSQAAFRPRSYTPGKAHKLHRQRTPQPGDSVVPSATHPPP